MALEFLSSSSPRYVSHVSVQITIHVTSVPLTQRAHGSKLTYCWTHLIHVLLVTISRLSTDYKHSSVASTGYKMLYPEIRPLLPSLTKESITNPLALATLIYLPDHLSSK